MSAQYPDLPPLVGGKTDADLADEAMRMLANEFQGLPPLVGGIPAEDESDETFSEADDLALKSFLEGQARQIHAELRHTKAYIPPARCHRCGRVS